MELLKETKVSLMTTDNQNVTKGSKILYTTKDGVNHVGIYDGLTARGSLIIKSLVESDKSVNVMVKSIDKLYLVSIEVIEKEF